MIFLLRLYVVQSNDQKAADLIHSLIEFLTNYSAKTYQSWLYSDLKGISPESTERLLEVPLADARKLEEAIANRNFIFFSLIVPHLSKVYSAFYFACADDGIGRFDHFRVFSSPPSPHRTQVKQYFRPL